MSAFDNADDKSDVEALDPTRPSSTLPCPLCGSRLILPVIRRAINCDIETHVYHCNGCGMEAPRHMWDYWTRPDRSERDWSEHLRIQLAAEVEKVNKLQEQLAAEREKHTPDKCRVCGMPELRCNHHRSPTNRPIYEQLREKVQTLVDALERITKSPFVVSEMVSVADDALAKVKEGEV